MQHKDYRYSRRRRREWSRKLVQRNNIENVQNVGKELEIQAKEANRTQNYINVKRPSPRHVVVNLAKVNDKEKILMAARQKKITYKGTPIRLSADFSEDLQARREWNEILKSLKAKNFQPRLLYPVKISFIYDRVIKTFPDKQKLREFITTRPLLKEMLEKAHIPEKKRKGLQSPEQRDKYIDKIRKLQLSIRRD
uniref:L1 transposable element RRM domain-containing protein n=1 Tax=Equus caballus TaxID=9796 RepID=A0A9L0RX97_HORSE